MKQLAKQKQKSYFVKSQHTLF